MQRRGAKTVLYLDQNWLSNIAKAYTNNSKSGEQSYYLTLSEAIQEGVRTNQLACPTSQFHETESSFSAKVRDSFWYIARRISDGLSFNSPIPIQHAQLIEAASKFAGKDLPDTPWWSIPFNKDPDMPASNLSDGPLRIHLSLDMLAEEEKRVRDDITTPLYRRYKETRRAANFCYAEEIQFSMVQLFAEGHTPLGLQKAAQLLDENTSYLKGLYDIAVLDSANRYWELAKVCDDHGEIGAFLQSPQFSNVPFLSIYARLMSADIVNYPYRNPEASLKEDFSIVATVVPYVNILATDNYIAELIKQTRIDQECNCQTFTMRQKENLLDTLRL